MMWCDYDAKDVMEYARKHPEDSDQEGAGDDGDHKRGTSESGFTPRKVARLGAAFGRKAMRHH